MTQLEALEHGVPGPEKRRWDITCRKSACPWQHMQMYVPGFLSIQAEMYALGGKRVHVRHRRAAHHLPQRRCLLHGQCRNVLTMPLEHDESLPGRQQRTRAQEDHPMRVVVDDAAGWLYLSRKRAARNTADRAHQCLVSQSINLDDRTHLSLILSCLTHPSNEMTRIRHR